MDEQVNIFESLTIPVGWANVYEAQRCAEESLAKNPKLCAQVLLAMRNPQYGQEEVKRLLREELRNKLVDMITSSRAIRLVSEELAAWMLENETELSSRRNGCAEIVIGVRSNL